MFKGFEMPAAASLWGCVRQVLQNWAAMRPVMQLDEVRVFCARAGRPC
jgi:hypothetical protein